MKIVKHYPDDFKQKVVDHYLNSEEGYKKTADRFNLKHPCLVHQWVCKFRGGLQTTFSMGKSTKKEKPPINQDSPEAMFKRIQEVEKELENERLKSQAMSTMIDVAERDLKIPSEKNLEPDGQGNENLLSKKYYGYSFRTVWL